MVEKLVGYEEEITRNDILSVQINLLNRCTSKCVSCKKYTWPDGKLELEDVKRVIMVLEREFGLKSVVLSGGDPVLYKDIVPLLKYIDERNIHCSMITTGITEYRYLLDAIARHTDRVHISLDACTSEDYKRIRGVDAFKIVDSNIKYLIDNGAKIRLSATISKLNYDKVYDLYRYAEDRGCSIKFFFVHTFDELKMDEKQLRKFYSQLCLIQIMEEDKEERISNARELLEEKPRKEVSCSCYVPYISCVINADGDIYPCCRLLKDNGYYGEQGKLAYGNIYNGDNSVKGYYELIEEFKNRIKQYPIAGNEECRMCGQRYQDMLEHLSKVKEKSKREVLFI